VFDRDISFALILIWFLAGSAVAAIWYAVTGVWPPVWARCVAGVILFPILMPLEAALARRYRRRKQRHIRHRKPAV
jgi:membrane protein implicated in regulation of membrane protease activity